MIITIKRSVGGGNSEPTPMSTRDILEAAAYRFTIRDETRPETLIELAKAMALVDIAEQADKIAARLDLIYQYGTNTDAR